MAGEAGVVVAGGGLAGLVASIYAARAGASVRLYERVSTLGGRARTREEHGFHFNMGPQALYGGGEGGEVLRELGIAPAGTTPPTSGNLALFEGRPYTLPAGVTSLLATRLLGAREKLEAGLLLARLPRRDFAADDAVPLGRVIEREVRSARVRALFEAIARLTSYAHDPERVSAGATLRQMLLAQTGGVLYLDGGWQSLVDALAAVARRSGVKIETGVSVESVEQDEAVRGVRLREGDMIAARAVVLTGGPGEASRVLPGDPALVEWDRRSIPVRLASLDLGLAELPRPAARFALGIDEPTYFSVHSGFASLAPPGGAMLHVSRYLAPDEQPERAEVEGQLEALLDTLQPGWRAHVVVRHFIPGLPVSHALVRAADGGLAGRPGPALDNRPGVFVAGDWVGPRGMLSDACFASGREAGRAAAAVALGGVSGSP